MATTKVVKKAAPVKAAAPIAKKVEQKTVPAAAPVQAERTVICESCGKEFPSKYSNAKYCPTCSADKKKATRKAANKRRIVNRKLELNSLREFVANLKGILKNGRTCAEQVNEIKGYMEDAGIL